MIVAAVYLTVGLLFACGVVVEGRDHGERVTVKDWFVFAAVWPAIVIVFAAYGLARAVRS